MADTSELDATNKQQLDDRRRAKIDDDDNNDSLAFVDDEEEEDELVKQLGDSARMPPVRTQQFVAKGE